MSKGNKKRSKHTREKAKAGTTQEQLGIQHGKYGHHRHGRHTQTQSKNPMYSARAQGCAACVRACPRVCTRLYYLPKKLVPKQKALRKLRQAKSIHIFS
jgi:NAD-dependent dihydropyrimidine dehydrogenase PreA subunit